MFSSRKLDKRFTNFPHSRHDSAVQPSNWLSLLNPQSVVVGLLSSVAVIVPGYLTLLLHKPQLIIDLDAPKIMLVCSGVTLPMLLTQLRLSAREASTRGLPAGARVMWIAVARTCFVLMLALSISYLSGVSFEKHVAITAVLHAMVWHACLGSRSGPSKP